MFTPESRSIDFNCPDLDLFPEVAGNGHDVGARRVAKVHMAGLLPNLAPRP
jgi:hypothetical protein